MTSLSLVPRTHITLPYRLGFTPLGPSVAFEASSRGLFPHRSLPRLSSSIPSPFPYDPLSLPAIPPPCCGRTPPPPPSLSSLGPPTPDGNPRCPPTDTNGYLCQRRNLLLYIPLYKQRVNRAHTLRAPRMGGRAPRFYPLSFSLFPLYSFLSRPPANHPCRLKCGKCGEDIRYTRRGNRFIDRSAVSLPLDRTAKLECARPQKVRFRLRARSPSSVSVRFSFPKSRR